MGIQRRCKPLCAASYRLPGAPSWGLATPTVPAVHPPVLRGHMTIQPPPLGHHFQTE